jgi:hypothetical protein
MPRLNDRAFHIVKNEIERCYKDGPEDQIERVILLSRLESLRTYPGKPMTRVEIWEVLSDVAPNFSQDVLMEAESVDTDSPLLGVSMGIGAVAVLVSAALGVDAVPGEVISAAPPSTTATLDRPSEKTIIVSAETSAVAAAEMGIGKEQPEPKFHSERQMRSLRQLLGLKPGETINERRPVPINSASAANPGVTDRQPFDLAKHIGWQAALKGQNPPHSAQHWGEAAALWSAAIAYLDQVPPQDSNYAAAQLKKSFYQHNLQQTRAHQAAALKIAQLEESKNQSAAQATSSDPSPKLAQSANQTPRFSAQSTENPIEVAKNYGWQAAVASQNAPHPAEEWADISRLWQAALTNLDRIERSHPSYAEAQTIKAQYEKNLSAIRDRYQQEQTAAQRLQSLQATLSEMDHYFRPDTTQAAQLQSIIKSLKSIPSGTQAYARAQQLIVDANSRMSEIDPPFNSQI